MRAKIAPKKGMIVRDPITKIALPEEGKEVEINSFWLRRLSSGDVVEVKSEIKNNIKGDRK